MQTIQTETLVTEIELSDTPRTIARILRVKDGITGYECNVYTYTANNQSVFVGAGAFSNVNDAETTAMKIFNNWWSN